MKSNKGFTFTEALVSLTIVIVIASSVVPLFSFVAYEKQALSHKRIIALELQDKLQNALYNHHFPATEEEKVSSIIVHYYFIRTKDQYIEACANWINIQDRDEELCIYGIPK